jgi:hypothetical protein
MRSREALKSPSDGALSHVWEKSAAGAAAGLQIPAGPYRGESSSATTWCLVQELRKQIPFGRTSDRRVTPSSCAKCGHDSRKGGGDKFARARRTRYPELRRCASSWISAARTAGSQCLIRTAAFAGGYYTTTLKRPVIRRAAVNLHRSSVSERCPEAFLIRPIAVSDYLFKLNLGREPTRSGRKRSSIDTTNQRQSCFCCNEGAIVEVRL